MQSDSVHDKNSIGVGDIKHIDIDRCCSFQRGKKNTGRYMGHIVYWSANAMRLALQEFPFVIVMHRCIGKGKNRIMYPTFIEWRNSYQDIGHIVVTRGDGFYFVGDYQELMDESDRHYEKNTLFVAGTRENPSIFYGARDYCIEGRQYVAIGHGNSFGLWDEPSEEEVKKLVKKYHKRGLGDA